ncbi:MAG: efflux RND transporter periplasmic adaptor subunit [Proteobacteria bacterium]|nr:efflux RND transporter periplasmic adaptor subunit [Pseudomonadota bacterium]MDA0994458.1 efflux RND transporter periplasmic adaptor subunit [Pseudomonadota bacterium]
MNLGNFERYKSWLVSAGIAVGIALWLLSGRIGNDADLRASKPEPTTHVDARTSVRVRNQTAEEVTRTITVNGKTAPARIVELNAETDGRVVSIGGERGDRLDRGEVIVRLDERDRSARLAQAVATVKQRELEFAARQKLMGESYVSEAQLQEASAMLEAARAELARAKLDIEYMVVRAPFNGALQERQVEIGDYVKTADPIATFVDERTLIVSANVSEFDAHNVSKGEVASAKLATGETVTGVIRYVAPMADEATRTFVVELEIDNAAGKYRGGMTAELMIPAETIFAHRISPALLTLDDNGNLGIKTVNERGLVEFHRADIAMSSGEGVWIAGLPHSAVIITVGQGFVNAGALVDSVTEVEVDMAVATKSAEQGQ